MQQRGSKGRGAAFSGETRPLTRQQCDIMEGRRRCTSAASLAGRTGVVRRMGEEDAAAISRAGGNVGKKKVQQ
ncbi:uncharacterized protein DS421_20g696880 [Arachis hypogaea]|nr:uncharacterized protein DS421_20g696880 [Arachis hypogaea]